MRAYGFGEGTRGFIEIDNELKALQDYVGGYIETVGLKNGLILICNEEGKIKNLPYRAFCLPIRQFITGNFLVVRAYEDEFCDLRKDDEKLIEETFKDMNEL